MLLDIDYILLGMPGIAFSLWAQWRIVSVCSAASRLPASSGLTGAEAALRVMQASGVGPVEIMPAAGQLPNHYDPSRKVLRLSRSVYAGRSLASLGIAAHEAGHAIQHASKYPGLIVRSAIVPLANLGSIAFWLLILAGLFLSMFRRTIWGLALFSLVVVLQLINLPIEFDASRRARQHLLTTELVTQEEEAVVGRVMNAAALTYVAAILTSVMSPLCGLFPFRLLFEFGAVLPTQPSAEEGIGISRRSTRIDADQKEL
ncbi:MAG TPA: zinc metallopeptidase [Isosphaeraceae bacterium]|nr:zinc metallopeptidase [Isosphaeraceae bacterium]